MPDVDGPALFAWVAAERSHLRNRFGFVTGDTLGPSAVRFLADTERPYIEKPFTRDSVATLLAQFDGQSSRRADHAAMRKLNERSRTSAD
jgi:hypothetical protein